MDLAAYLRRLDYDGPVAATPGFLSAVHKAHHLSVPFENLDIWLKRRIVLDEESFFRKIVLGRRGGFCYELNGLFAAALRQVGFEVTLLSGRVPRKDIGFTPEFDHMILRVETGQTYLADVGFGEAFQSPIVFREGYEETQDGVRYRLIRSGDRWLAQRNSGGEWNLLYDFSDVPRALADFSEMCDYHQTSPDSNFTRRRICSLARRDGRVTLADQRLIITSGAERCERILSDPEYLEALREYFGICLPYAAVAQSL